MSTREKGADDPAPLQEDFEDLYQNAPCGYTTLSLDGSIVLANATLCNWLGCSIDDVIGKKFTFFLPVAGKIYYETHFAPLLRMQGFFNEVALELTSKNGARLPALVNAVERRDASGAAQAIRMTIFNATDRRRYEKELLAARAAAERATNEVKSLNASLETKIESALQEQALIEESLRQSQKMEAIGQLTGGIAHDFNNLLAGISGSLEMLQMRLAGGGAVDTDRYINAAHTGVKRAATLTHRLLAFSRRQPLDPKRTDVNALIAGMSDLIHRTVGPAVQVEVVGAVSLWYTKVDASQLENALLNLCINARDAMPAGGRLTIETANKWIDDHTAQERDLLPGQYVQMCVSDTGCGMTPDVIAHAFDPFFTTKPLGEGTGLGLSMIHGFARQSGGQVRIYSEIGKGTTMCIYLPRDTTAETDEEKAVVIQTPGTGHGETVLVVDDEPTLRTVISEVLNSAGYIAVLASDGPSALRVLQSDSRIDLLITDVGLPGGMNGRQIVDAARATRPNLKALFITGYAENAVVGEGRLLPGMAILTKPFPMMTMIQKVRDMLDQSPRST
jgi:PAS domain S-box-containing protein